MIIEGEEKECLREGKVGVFGGGVIIELLKRYNFKEIRGIEKEVEEELIYLDVFYNEEHIGTLPKYSSLGNTCVASFYMPKSVEEFKRVLKGVDVVIGGYGGNEEQKKAAIAASELGTPFITYPIITTVLPDGILFEEIELCLVKVDATLNTLIRFFQVMEVIKLFTGVGKPFFPLNALLIEFDMFNLNLDKKEIRLKLKK